MSLKKVIKPFDWSRVEITKSKLLKKYRGNNVPKEKFMKKFTFSEALKKVVNDSPDSFMVLVGSDDEKIIDITDCSIFNYNLEDHCIDQYYISNGFLEASEESSSSPTGVLNKVSDGSWADAYTKCWAVVTFNTETVFVEK